MFVIFRGGVELRIWRALEDHRYLNEPKQNHRRESDSDPANTMVIIECQKCSSSQLTTNGSANQIGQSGGSVRAGQSGESNGRLDQSNLDESTEDYSGSGIVNL